MPEIPLRLVTRNLFKHPLRSTLTVGSLVVSTFLVCCLHSLVESLDAGVQAARSDRFIVQSAVSLFVYLPNSYEAKIRGLPGVESTCRWNWFGGVYQDASNFFAQFATDHDTLLDIYPEIVLESGSAEDFKRERTACLIGSDLATRFGWQIGDSVPLIGMIFPRTDGSVWNFKVAGIYRSTSSNVDNQTMFFHYDYLEETVDSGGANGPTGAGLYVVKVAPGAVPVEVMAQVDALFENGPQRVQSTSEAEFQAQFVSMVGNIPFFVSSIGGGVFFAILLAVVNTMLLAAREQSQDVGILKALGFSRVAIFLMFLLQSLAVALAGGGLGIGLALLASGPLAQMLGTSFPNYRLAPETMVLAAGMCLAIGLLAGVIPALRLSRLAPVDALRTEV